MSGEIVNYIKRLEAKIDRIERKLSMLVQEKKKPTWVKSSVIKDLTGWGQEKMRQARDNGYVDFKVQQEDGRKVFWYDVGSLRQVFLKKEFK